MAKAHPELKKVAVCPKRGATGECSCSTICPRERANRNLRRKFDPKWASKDRD